MKRLLSTLLAIALIAAIATAFAGAFTMWHSMEDSEAASVMPLFAVATALTIALFLVGQVLSIQSHAYYLIVSGAVFLGVDFLVWQEFGIMPGRKVLRDGFIPAGIMGVFLGPLYKVIAIRASAMRRS